MDYLFIYSIIFYQKNTMYVKGLKKRKIHQVGGSVTVIGGAKKMTTSSMPLRMEMTRHEHRHCEKFVWKILTAHLASSHYICSPFSLICKKLSRRGNKVEDSIIKRVNDMGGREEDVEVGASKYSERRAIGTGAQSFRDYVEPPPAPLFEGEELVSWSFYRAGIAEFVASFLFLYITVLTIIGVKRSSSMCASVGLQGIAWAVGGMIFVLVYCTAGISGGHINPAVTFGLLLARKLSVPRAVFYMVMQCLGAICGAGMVKGFQTTQYEMLGGGVNLVSPGYTKGTGLGAEIIGTFVLVYTVFSATDAKRSARDSHVPILAPLPIGFAVFLVHLATIPITGTGINPARSLGAAIVYNRKEAWDDQWIFWVGPFIGAALAAIYHQIVIRAIPFKSRA